MDFPKPTTYTPFFRRFTNERAKEIEETRALYHWVRRNTPEVSPAAIAVDVRPYFAHVSLAPELEKTLEALIQQERYLFEPPAPNFERMNLEEFVAYRNFLHQKQYFIQNQTAVLQKLNEGLVRIFGELADGVPEARAPSPFTVPFVHALPAPGVFVTRLVKLLYEEEYANIGLFIPLRVRMNANMYDASGIPQGEKARKPFTFPHESKLPLPELNDAYLDGTPFHALFKIPVPLKLTHDDRMNHMHVVGGTGAGKTTLLENLILHDLESEDAPSLVIVDSQGDLIRKLSHLGCFDPDNGRFKDRFVLISPKDVRHPPALNIFDVNKKRLGTYDEVIREQVVAGVIQTFDYLFAGLLGADLTAKQGVFFKYVARLMLALPESVGRNATILDMMHLMENVEPYRTAIASLPPIQRNFFERDFQSKTFAQTKEQIRYRLQAVIENPTIAKLFTSPSTKVDLFEEMNRGSIILVDTSKDFLKGSSSHFGRIFISLVLQAVLERAALPERERRDTFLIIDEAASYFDSNIDDLLTDARKYRCGCVFAHQYLDQASSSLRASLAANTGTKFAAGVSTSDARAMATDMRTTQDFILSQPRLHFAAHIRNVTPQAVSIPVQLRALERQPQLSNQAHERLLEANRSRVSLPNVVQDNVREAAGTSIRDDIASGRTDESATEPSPDW